MAYNLKMAWDSIRSSRLRSFLSMLGVIVGVAVTVVLISVGESAKGFVTEQIESFGMGPNALVIHPGQIDPPVEPSKLTYEDVKKIRSQIPEVTDAIPFIMGTRQVIYGKRKHKTMIYGVSANYPLLLNHEVQAGRFFTDVDVEAARPVCLFGKTAAEKLFGNFNPVGEAVRIEGRRISCIGVMKEKGEMLGFNMDDIVIVPITTAQKILETTKILEIAVWARSEEEIEIVQSKIKRLLLSRHLGSEDFHFHTQKQMVSVLGNIVNSLTLFVAAVAALSLVVGSIGIMNIMLASVRERYREIGIRKAIGATTADIYRQFFFESVTIGLGGGVVGGLTGIGATIVITRLLKFPTIVPWWCPALALVVSVLVGVGAGVYPASRAARLQPVEALRYE